MSSLLQSELRERCKYYLSIQERKKQKMGKTTTPLSSQRPILRLLELREMDLSIKSEYKGR
nr:MAG TPA: hypothetical protein [Caudoviricetes sp.]